MSRIKNSQSGFTIVEVMVALVVLAVGLMSAAAMQTRAVDESNNAARMSERVTGAELVLEDFMGRTVVPTDPDLDPVFAEPDEEWHDMTGSPPSQTYAVQYKILEATPLDSLMTIQVAATPAGMDTTERERKQITFAFIRSTRFN